MESSEKKFDDLKEALNKFILQAKDGATERERAVSYLVQDLLAAEALAMTDEEYTEYTSSEDYYSSSC